MPHPDPPAFDWRAFVGSGDHRAACRILDRLIPPGMRARFDGEDFVQDALAEVVAAGGRIDLSRPVFSLVLKVARRRLLDERLRPRQRAVEGPLIGAADAADPTPSPPDAAIAAELRAGLVAIGSTPALREVIRLRLDGAEVGEIARATGRSVAATSVYLKRIGPRAAAVAAVAGPGH